MGCVPASCTAAVLDVYGVDVTVSEGFDWWEVSWIGRRDRIVGNCGGKGNGMDGDVNGFAWDHGQLEEECAKEL